MRGGEKVLLSLAGLFPDAPIYTLLHVKGSVAPELEARTIRTSFVQWLPNVEERYRQYLPLFPSAAASLDLSGYDLVVSSSHCVAKGVRVREGALHVCYCHTPDALRLGPLRRLLRRGTGFGTRRASSCRSWRRACGRGTWPPPRACTSSPPTAVTWPAASVATTSATRR